MEEGEGDKKREKKKGKEKRWRVTDRRKGCGEVLRRSLVEKITGCRVILRPVGANMGLVRQGR